MRKYGWSPDVPSPHDPRYMPPAMATLPDAVDLRPQFPPPFDQGSLGSCVAQALAGVLQVGQGRPTPSRLYIYYNARVLQGSVASDSGTTLRTGVRSLQQYGHCEESYWPYEVDKWKNKPPRDCYRRSAPNRFTKAERLDQDADQVRSALAVGRPVAFGFSAYAAFESEEVRHSGLLALPGADDRLLGGHAVVCVGYTPDGHFLVRNSWGDKWGDGGYFRMPFEYVLSPDLAGDFWVVNFLR